MWLRGRSVSNKIMLFFLFCAKELGIRMEAQGIGPRLAPCKGAVLPLDYASLFYLACALQNSFILLIASANISFVAAETSLACPSDPNPLPLVR